METQTRPLGVQLAHMLKARGIDTVFGIPGVHNVELYRGLAEAGLTHVLARHEQGAGFMADGYARACGRPGVAFVITGPGLTNLLTPLGQAYSDSVPVLAISSCLDETAAVQGQLHQMRDQRGAAATVCDWSEEARDAAAAYALVDRALTEFATARARPKHIQIPIRVLSAPASAPGAPPVLADAPGLAGMDAVFSKVFAARRPLFLLGGGCRGAVAAVRALVARLGAATMMSYAGRGVAVPDDPLSFGSALARPDSAAVLRQADLVVALGTELAEVDLWRDTLGYDGPLIRVDRDPRVLADGAATLALACRVEDFATALLAAVPDAHRPASGWEAGAVAATRARWRAEVDAERPGILPVAEALRACLPEGTMIYSDMTQFAYAAKEVWDMDAPGHWHHPTGFGTLGYALPAAIGGAVARQGAPTLAIAGDYGFQYTVQEMGTAVELGLPLPIFLWDNGKLKEIEECMVARQIAPNAVIARNPEFPALARAYGAAAVAPETLGEMQAAVRAAFDAPGPTLIHVRPDIRPG